MTSINILEIKNYFTSLQKNICDVLTNEEEDQTFQYDAWESKLGTGVTRVLENGAILERAGVNFSHVTGSKLPSAASVARPELSGGAFEALGISMVIHPRNPFAPTMHANLRFFCVRTDSENFVWWFGGGLDLTPYYGFEEDCQHWHGVAKKVCDPFGPEIYFKYKKWCDEYFFIKHRNEPRGIGGLFFDDLNHWEFSKCFEFVKSLGNNITTAYQPILNLRKKMSYTEQEKNFQLFRRGRYVEFNLVYDRGTLFGLQSGSRTESILVSMPPEVKWGYQIEVAPGSKEAELYEKYLIAKDWV